MVSARSFLCRFSKGLDEWMVLLSWYIALFFVIFFLSFGCFRSMLFLFLIRYWIIKKIVKKKIEITRLRGKLYAGLLFMPLSGDFGWCKMLMVFLNLLWDKVGFSDALLVLCHNFLKGYSWKHVEGITSFVSMSLISLCFIAVSLLSRISYPLIPFFFLFLEIEVLITCFFPMQNSRFLQFVSKMSRGELIIDDNQVKETALPASGDWAAEYQQQYNHDHAWAGEFLNDKVCPKSWKPYSFASDLHYWLAYIQLKN